MTYEPVNPADALDQGVQQINAAFDNVAKWFRGASAPSSPEAGMKWYNTTDSTLYVRADDNLSWLPCLLLDAETGLIVTDGEESITIQAPSTLSEDYTLRLPPAQGGSQQFLRNDGSGNLSWVSGGASGATELDGLSDVTLTAEASGQYLCYDGASWINAAVDLGHITTSGQTTGDLVYYTGSAWARLARGTDGQVLKSTPTSVAWEDETGGGGSVSDLNDLTDVVIGTPTSGEYFRFNGTVWTDSSLLATDITTPTSATGDILVRGASGYARLALGTSGQVLTSDGSTVGWEDAVGGTIPETLDDLTDVTITTPSGGQYLRHNGSVFVNASPSLTDLQVGSQAEGDLAYFNGTTWNRLARGTSGQFLRATASTVGWESVTLGATDLDGLSDVTVATPSSGQVIQYNGSAWTNSPLGYDEIGTGGSSRGDVIVRTATGWDRLALGTSGQILTSDGTDVAWDDAVDTGATTLTELTDVTISSAAAGEYVRYNGSAWVDSPLIMSDLQVGSQALGDLAYFNGTVWTRLARGVDGQVLKSTPTSVAWENEITGSSSLQGLSDVTITAAADGDYLRHNGVTWVDAAGVTLADLTHASEAEGDLAYFNGTAWTRLGKGTNGQVLKATATTIAWDDESAGGSTTIGGLTDVTITAAADGDYLRFNGTAWVDVAGIDVGDLTVGSEARGDVIVRGISGWQRLALGTSGQVLTSDGTDVGWDDAVDTGATTLTELTDVTISSAAAGEYLRYNGSAWVDSPLIMSDLQVGSQALGDLAYFNGTVWTRLARGTNGQVLKATATTIEWDDESAGGSTTIGGLTDVTITAAADGDYLRFNGAAWVDVAGLDIGDLTVGSEARGDVIVRGISGWQRLALGTSGQILTSDGTDVGWDDAPATGATTLGELTDVTPSSPVAGSYLRHNGSVWSNTADGLPIGDLSLVGETRGDLIVRNAGAFGRLAVGGSGTVLKSNGTDPSWGALTLTDLSGVTISSAAAGEYLRYNGSAWVDSPLIMSDLQVGSQALGDLAYFNGTVWTRLARGTNGQVLKATATTIEWDDESAGGSTTIGGLTDVTITAAADGDYLRFNGSAWVDVAGLDIGDLTVGSEARGDVIVRGISGWQRLALGTSGQILTSDGTDVGWDDAPATGATTLGELTDVTPSSPVAGSYLRHNGSVWSNTADGLPIGDLSLIGETRGDLIVRNAGAFGRLAVGGSGTVLKSNGTDPSWGALTLTDLSGVTISSAASGEYLRYNGSAWVDSPLILSDLQIGLQAEGDLAYFNGTAWTRLGKGTNGQVLKATATTIEWDDESAGGSTTLGGLTDVTITSPVAGDHIRFNGSAWVNTDGVHIGDLNIESEARGDIIVRSLTGWTRLALGTSGQVLTSDGTDVGWDDAAGGGGTLGGLSDVVLTSPAANQYVRYNGTTWVNVALQITDLTHGSEALGDLAYYNGTTWNRLPRGTDNQFLRSTATSVAWETVNVGATSLTGLSDVTIGSPSAGQVIRYNGSLFTNATPLLSDLAIGSQAQGDLAYYNGSSWTRLGKGTNGQVLKATATTIQWDDESAGGSTTLGGLTDVTITAAADGDYLRFNGTAWVDVAGLDIGDLTVGSEARGDVIVRGISGWQRLALGTSGQILTSDGTDVGWDDAPAAGATTLGGLTDVTVTGAGTGDYLQFNGSAWVDVSTLDISALDDGAQAVGDLIVHTDGGWAVLPVGGSGQVLTTDGTDVLWDDPVDTGATTLTGLTDVTISSAASGEYLRYNGSLWVDSPLIMSDLQVGTQTLGDLAYFNGTVWTRLARGTNGQVLKATATTIEWDDESAGGSTTLGGLTDVTITAAADGDYLRFNGTAWVDVAGIDVGDLTVGSEARGDVIVRGISGWQRLALGTSGQVLTSDGTDVGWDDAVDTGATNLTELTDVTISSAAAGEYLRYNGSAWVDSPLIMSDLQVGSQALGDLAYFNGTVWTRLARGTNGQVLKATATTIEWDDESAGGSTTIGGLTDVTITAAADGDYLRFNGSAWVDVAGLDIGDLTVGSEARGDVIVRGISGWQRLALGTSGQILTSDGTDVGWDDAPATGATTLGGLTDVTITAAASGDYLRHNGSAWVDVAGVDVSDLAVAGAARGDLVARGVSAFGRLEIGAAGTVLQSDGTDPSWGALTLTDLSGVTISSAASGEYLRYNGSAWVDSPLIMSDLQVGAQALGDLAYFNGTVWTRLARGTNGQVLKATATTIEWDDESAGGSTTLGGLTDVTITSPVAGDHLRYNGSAWVNTDGVHIGDLNIESEARGDIIVRSLTGWTRLALGTSGQVLTSDGTDVGWDDASGGGGTLGGLSDVVLTSPSAGAYIRYNGSNWVNVGLQVTDLTQGSEVLGDLMYYNGSTWNRLPRGTDNQFLRSTATSVAWETVNVGATNLSGLSDVNIGTPSAGQVIRYNGSLFTNATPLVSDLAIASQANGDLAYYNGSTWTRLPRGSNGQVLQATASSIQWAAAGSSSLAALTDVTIGAAAEGDYLRHNGTAWVDHAGVDIADLFITNEDRGDILTFDGTGWSRLAIGATNQVLTSNGTTVSWATPSGGGATTLGDLTDVSTTGAANGDLLLRGASSWGILDASAASSNSVLEWTGSATQWKASTGTGNIVRANAPTFTGVVNLTSFVANSACQAQSMGLKAIVGGNVVSHLCANTAASYNIVWPSSGTLPESGTYYLKISSSGNISFSAT